MSRYTLLKVTNSDSHIIVALTKLSACFIVRLVNDEIFASRNKYRFVRMKCHGVNLCLRFKFLYLLKSGK